MVKQSEEEDSASRLINQGKAYKEKRLEKAKEKEAEGTQGCTFKPTL